ncbi:MAG: VanZ family protein [Candidatus Omnitrophota bacterium]|nr:MAG: VanZ family protein [Candidatus Omnitrophota bacterium]
MMRYLFSSFSVSFYSFIILLLSVLPLRVKPPLDISFFDQIVHFFTYALLSFIVLNTFLLKKKINPRMISFSYAVLWGLLIEIIQFFLPYRDFQGTDLFANLLGSGTGCFIRIVR